MTADLDGHPSDGNQTMSEAAFGARCSMRAEAFHYRQSDAGGLCTHGVPSLVSPACQKNHSCPTLVSSTDADMWRARGGAEHHACSSPGDSLGPHPFKDNSIDCTAERQEKKRA